VAEKPPAGMKPADVEAYRNNAIFYLKLSLEKDPEQPFAEYSRIADKLMGFKDYADAAQIYVNGMKKYQAEIGPTPVWWGTLAKVGECYFNLGQWKPALEVYKQLDEHVKKDPNKALLYKENLGLCYENLALSYEEQAISQKDPQEKEKALAEARNLWQKALSEAWNILNDKLPQGTPKCFEAKIHQIHCFVKLGDDVSAWKNFAQQTLFAWPDMGGPDIKKQFMELLDKDLPTHKQEFEDMVKKLEGKK
jgi:tetratricopeptide (TPR) repeat protein